MHLFPTPFRSTVATLILVLACSARPSPAQEASLDVFVRARAEAAPGPKKSGKDAAPAKVFGIFPASEIPATEKIIRPVTPDTINTIYGYIQESLTAQGFVGAQPKQRPDFVVTVQYGRGFLPNPYSNTVEGSGDLQGLDSSPANGKSSDRASGSSSNAKSMLSTSGGLSTFPELGKNAKLAAANQEKLFIVVAAFEFASMQKGKKPHKLWETTMNVDDPDHRDLNQVYHQMMTAGGRYFGQALNKPEIEVATDIRNGQVEIRAPKVVDEPPAVAK